MEIDTMKEKVTFEAWIGDRTVSEEIEFETDGRNIATDAYMALCDRIKKDGFTNAHLWWLSKASEQK